MDKICAEVMRALDIKVSWLILLSNDTKISGTAALNPQVWVVVFDSRWNIPSGPFFKDDSVSLEMLSNCKGDPDC